MARGQRTRVDAENLVRRLQRVSELAGVRQVVIEHTAKLEAEIVTQASKPVQTTTRRGKAVKLRSKRGQAPRKDTGRLVHSIRSKISPKGTKGTVTTGPSAVDAKGRRYSWMLESGTATIKKRPLFTRAKRKLKKAYLAAIVAAAKAAIRGG